MSLTSNQKEQLQAFAHTQDGKMLKEIVEQLVSGLCGYNTMDTDAIKSRSMAVDYIKTNLLEPLTPKQVKEKADVETYE